MTVGAWNDVVPFVATRSVDNIETSAAGVSMLVMYTLTLDRATTCRPASRSCSRFAGRLEASAVLSKPTTRDRVAEGLTPTVLQHAALYGTALTLKPGDLQGQRCNNLVATRRGLKRAVL